MGTTQAGLTAITKNIEAALEAKNLTKVELADAACISKTTLYRNLRAPEAFSFKQIGNIAAALELPITELVKDAA